MRHICICRYTLHNAILSWVYYWVFLWCSLFFFEFICFHVFFIHVIAKFQEDIFIPVTAYKILKFFLLKILVGSDETGLNKFFSISIFVLSTSNCSLYAVSKCLVLCVCSSEIGKFSSTSWDGFLTIFLTLYIFQPLHMAKGQKVFCGFLTVLLLSEAILSS